MKHFAPSDESSNPANSQYNNHRTPPRSIMAAGFMGARPGRIGTPVVAEWFNWLFSQLTVSAPFYMAKPDSGQISIPNLFAYRVDATQIIKAFEIRGFADDGSLSNRKLVPMPNYRVGSTAAPINGVVVAADVININVNTTCGSASKHVLIQPLTEAP
jgi:hypothetical protein|nr:MAG TPA: hypothetical protein [Caudoviricetes sp.]